MNTIRNGLFLGGLLGFAAMASATRVPSGTEVLLRFEDPVSSKHAKAGDHVHFTVARDVRVGGRTILPAGKDVTGTISNVDKRGRYGKNARIRLTIDPVRVPGGVLNLEPRDKGKPFSGSRTDHAAIATGAGALILGPLGLAGGYFVVGKQVNIKAGDTLRTEVTRNVDIR